MKWYDEMGTDSSVVVGGRIRLVRNLKEYRFPGMLKEEETEALTKELCERLKKISGIDGRSYESCVLGSMDHTVRMALRERQIINQAAADHPGKSGLLLSKDEAVSVTINSVDHIRLQVNRSGMELKEIWALTDRIDDCINEMYSYAFDQKLGYMTAYPTNLGTGMKAYLILHLPLLDSVKKFQEMVSEISRYGVKLKPAFGNSKEECGNLYVLTNQKTLGISEQDIIQVMEKVAGQLSSQEKNMRQHSIQNHRIHAEDICYKAYGNLKYSKLVSLSSGMQLLSSIRWGQEEQLITFEKYCNIYELMIGIQAANLCTFYDKELQGTELDQARAEYIHKFLPEIRQ